MKPTTAVIKIIDTSKSPKYVIHNIFVMVSSCDAL